MATKPHKGVQQRDSDDIQLNLAIDAVLNIVAELLKGNSNFTGAHLRYEIVHQMPADITLAEKYNNAMKKMKIVGELLSNTSNEEFLVRTNRG